MIEFLLSLILGINIEYLTPKCETEFSIITGDRLQYGYIYTCTRDIPLRSGLISNNLHNLHLQYNFSNHYLRSQVGYGDYFDYESVIGYNYKFINLECGYSKSDKFVINLNLNIIF